MKKLLTLAVLFAGSLSYVAQAQVFVVEERSRFHDFIMKLRHPSFLFREKVQVGVVLPEAGVTFYDIPSEYHVRPGYRYAVVNDRVVIVDPRSRRIEEIIE